MSNRDFTNIRMAMTVNNDPTMFFNHVLQPHGEGICENCTHAGTPENPVYLCEQFEDFGLTQRDYQSGGDLSYCSNCIEEQFQGEPDIWPLGVKVEWSPIKAKCIQCATNRKVVEIMGGGHLVLSTCGHVVSIEVAQEREAFVQSLKEMDLHTLLDKFQEVVMESSYQSYHDQDQIFAVRAEIASRVK